MRGNLLIFPKMSISRLLWGDRRKLHGEIQRHATLCCLTVFKWSLKEELLNIQHLHTPCGPEHCGHFSGTLSTHFLLRPLSGSFLINVIVTSWLSKWLEYLLIISSYGLRLPYEADHVIVLSPPNIDLSLMKVLMYFDMCPSIETFNQQSESYDSNLAKISLAEVLRLLVIQ